MVVHLIQFCFNAVAIVCGSSLGIRTQVLNDAARSNIFKNACFVHSESFTHFKSKLLKLLYVQCFSASGGVSRSVQASPQLRAHARMRDFRRKIDIDAPLREGMKVSLLDVDHEHLP